MKEETPALVGKDLKCSFGDGDTRIEVLHGVSLALPRSRISVIMGPSGSGKSTLLAILSGLLRPDEGEVFALGRPLWQMTDKEREKFRLRHCGFIFQGHNLFPALTARQQLEIVLHWGEGRRGPTVRAETDAMLARLGLPEAKRRLRPRELSGGEKQRVVIGRALIKKPTFCFADEPTASLDWQNGQRVVELLQQAAREYQAAVFDRDARRAPEEIRRPGVLPGRRAAGASTAGAETLSPARRPAGAGRSGRGGCAMNAESRLLPVVTSVGLALLVGGPFLETLVMSSGAVAPSLPETSADAQAATAAVCFGHVDLENGVLALSCTEPGRVAQVLVRENQDVKEGAILLRLEDTSARLRVEEAAAALAACRSQSAMTAKLIEEQDIKLAAQKAGVKAIAYRLSAAEHLREYKQHLYDIKQLSDKDLHTAEDLVEEVKALKQVEEEKLRELTFHKRALEQDELSRTRAEMTAVEARLKQAREALAQCELRAPTAGRVLRLLVARGQVLGPQTRQPAVQFWPAGEPLIVRAEVDQEFGRVAEGQLARVEDYFDSNGFKGTGTVKRVSHWYTQRRTVLDDPMQFKDVRTLECIIDALRPDPGADRPLRIGQRMRVKISGDRTTVRPAESASAGPP